MPVRLKDRMVELPRKWGLIIDYLADMYPEAKQRDLMLRERFKTKFSDFEKVYRSMGLHYRPTLRTWTVNTGMPHHPMETRVGLVFNRKRDRDSFSLFAKMNDVEM